MLNNSTQMQSIKDAHELKSVRGFINCGSTKSFNISNRKLLMGIQKEIDKIQEEDMEEIIVLKCGIFERFYRPDS